MITCLSSERSSQRCANEQISTLVTIRSKLLKCLSKTEVDVLQSVRGLFYKSFRF